MQKKILELKLETMTLGGDALGTLEGKKIFVPWGVAGDRVRVEVVEDKKDFSRAKILEVLEKSPHRQEAPCKYFFKCGGCQWQHIQYASQLQFKNEILKSSLQKIGKISDPKILEAISAPQELHYRNRIRLQVSRKGVMGFFRTQSKEVIEIEECLLAEEELNQKIPAAKKLAEELLKKDNTISHEIEIRSQKNLSGSKVKVSLAADVEGEAHFGQINSLQNEVLKKRVLDLLDLKGDEKVLELFAGSGNFTFPLSAQAKSVIAIESHAEAVQLAYDLMKKKHVRNVEFIESSAHRYLANLNSDTNFDRILLDPPRAGMLEGIEELKKLKASTILYISCDPATLARDLRILIDQGYQHEFSQVIDMFPQTYHIESITRLQLA